MTHSEHGRVPAPGVENVVIPAHPSLTYLVPNTNPNTDLETLDPDVGEYLYS